MAKAKKTETAAPEAVQEGREPRDAQAAQAAVATAEAAQAGQVTREVIGPENPDELLGCQGDPPLEYAVAGCDLLNLREAPDLDAPIITQLPRGVGVSDTGRSQGNWWEVATGRLTGWVMAEYLEPVWR